MIGLPGILGLLLAVLAFGFLVFIHELGHFIAAKKSGVKVNEFSIGMGPALFSKTKGDTTYSIRAVPIGGFVAMEGELDESSDGRAFGQASLGNRAIIMVAGAFMNLLVGFLLMGLLTGVQLSKKDALIPINQVGGFYEGSVSNEWLEPGDFILEINGKKTKTYSEVTYQLSRDEDGIMDILVNRDGENILLRGVTFDFTEVEDGSNLLVLDFIPIGKQPNFFNGTAYTFERTISISKQIWASLVDLVTGKLGINQLSGPVGITKQMTTISSTGDWQMFILFVAMLSLNLGIFNLLPFPALDGGRLIFLVIEALRGKPVDQKYEAAVNLVGIVLLFGLMIVVSFNDVFKLFG